MWIKSQGQTKRNLRKRNLALTIKLEANFYIWIITFGQINIWKKSIPHQETFWGMFSEPAHWMQLRAFEAPISGGGKTYNIQLLLDVSVEKIIIYKTRIYSVLST